jgi:hypothetical protein
MTTCVKTSETNRYVTLARDVDLRPLAAGRARLRQFRPANNGR